MPRILIADDDLVQLDLCKLLLESAGHQVRAALSAVQTLSEAAFAWADLLILDLRFPEAEHGLALIRDLRESGCQVPILLLSGWPDDLFGRPEEQLVSAVLVKPVPPADLFAAIDRVTRNSSLHFE